MKFIKNTIINIGLTLFTLVIIFVFAEAGTRLYIDIKKRFEPIVVKNIPDIKLGYKMQLDEESKYKLNSHSFRDREFTFKKSANTFRIINLGDSITFGIGVELEHVYNKVLERMLNMTFGDKINYEVLNMGVGGYNSRQEYLLLKEKGIFYQPDFVLLGFFYNDSDQVLIVDTFGILSIGEPEDAIGWKDMSFRDWIKKSSFAVLVHSQLSKKFKKNPNAIPRYMNLRVKEKSWLIMKDYLKKINTFCTERNIKFVIINFPSGYQLDFKEDDWLIQRDISNFSDENNIPFLDLTPFLKMHKGENNLFVVDNQHPGKKGHEIAAKQIFNFLINNKLISTSDNNNFHMLQ